MLHALVGIEAYYITMHNIFGTKLLKFVRWLPFEEWCLHGKSSVQVEENAITFLT